MIRNENTQETIEELNKILREGEWEFPTSKPRLYTQLEVEVPNPNSMAVKELEKKEFFIRVSRWGL